MPKHSPAPPLQVAAWINTPKPLSLADFRGRVLLIEAFQMLCPGCVSQGLPQAQRVRQVFGPADIAIIGLHTVFEHHAAQGGIVPLEAFAHEYRLDFPIGVDQPGAAGGAPRTMQAYAMQGTPTLILVDRLGRRRLQRFGHLDDLALGSALATLIAEPGDSESAASAKSVQPAAVACTTDGCPVPPRS